MKNKNYLLSETFINNAVNYIASVCENDDGNGDGKEIAFCFNGSDGEYWVDMSREELTEKLKSFKKVSELEDYIQDDLGWEIISNFSEFVEDVEEYASECEA